MILHVRIRPDGNGTVYTGTPEELKKRLTGLHRTWTRIGRGVPYYVAHEVQAWEGGSRFYIIQTGYGSFDIMERGKYCPTYTGHGYKNFGPALNKLLALMQEERAEV